MKLSFDEIVELIHREMYVRNGVMLGEKAAAKAILQAEEAAQHRVQADMACACPLDEFGLHQMPALPDGTCPTCRKPYR